MKPTDAEREAFEKWWAGVDSLNSTEDIAWWSWQAARQTAPVGDVEPLGEVQDVIDDEQIEKLRLTNKRSMFVYTADALSYAIAAARQTAPVVDVEPVAWINFDTLTQKERIERLPRQSLQPGVYKHTKLYSADQLATARWAGINEGLRMAAEVCECMSIRDDRHHEGRSTARECAAFIRSMIKEK